MRLPWRQTILGLSLGVIFLTAPLRSMAIAGEPTLEEAIKSLTATELYALLIQSPPQLYGAQDFFQILAENPTWTPAFATKLSSLGIGWMIEEGRSLNLEYNDLAREHFGASIRNLGPLLFFLRPYSTAIEDLKHTKPGQRLAHEERTIPKESAEEEALQRFARRHELPESTDRENLRAFYQSQGMDWDQAEREIQGILNNLTEETQQRRSTTSDLEPWIQQWIKTIKEEREINLSILGELKKKPSKLQEKPYPSFIKAFPRIEFVPLTKGQPSAAAQAIAVLGEDLADIEFKILTRPPKGLTLYQLRQKRRTSETKPESLASGRDIVEIRIPKTGQRIHLTTNEAFRIHEQIADKVPGKSGLNDREIHEAFRLFLREARHRDLLFKKILSDVLHIQTKKLTKDQAMAHLQSRLPPAWTSDNVAHHSWNLTERIANRGYESLRSADPIVCLEWSRFRLTPDHWKIRDELPSIKPSFLLLNRARPTERAWILRLFSQVRRYGNAFYRHPIRTFLGSALITLITGIAGDYLLSSGLSAYDLLQYQHWVDQRSPIIQKSKKDILTAEEAKLLKELNHQIERVDRGFMWLVADHSFTDGLLEAWSTPSPGSGRNPRSHPATMHRPDQIGSSLATNFTKEELGNEIAFAIQPNKQDLDALPTVFDTEQISWPYIRTVKPERSLRGKNSFWIEIPRVAVKNRRENLLIPTAADHVVTEVNYYSTGMTPKVLEGQLDRYIETGTYLFNFDHPKVLPIGQEYWIQVGFAKDPAPLLPNFAWNHLKEEPFVKQAKDLRELGFTQLTRRLLNEMASNDKSTIAWSRLASILKENAHYTYEKEKGWYGRRRLNRAISLGEPLTGDLFTHFLTNGCTEWQCNASARFTDVFFEPLQSALPPDAPRTKVGVIGAWVREPGETLVRSSGAHLRNYIIDGDIQFIGLPEYVAREHLTPRHRAFFDTTPGLKPTILQLTPSAPDTDNRIPPSIRALEGSPLKPLPEEPKEKTPINAIAPDRARYRVELPLDPPSEDNPLPLFARKGADESKPEIDPRTHDLANLRSQLKQAMVDAGLRRSQLKSTPMDYAFHLADLLQKGLDEKRNEVQLLEDFRQAFPSVELPTSVNFAEALTLLHRHQKGLLRSYRSQPSKPVLRKKITGSMRTPPRRPSGHLALAADSESLAAAMRIFEFSTRTSWTPTPIACGRRSLLEVLRLKKPSSPHP